MSAPRPHSKLKLKPKPPLKMYSHRIGPTPLRHPALDAAYLLLAEI